MSQQDGNIAMAIFARYVMAQFNTNERAVVQSSVQSGFGTNFLHFFCRSLCNCGKTLLICATTHRARGVDFRSSLTVPLPDCSFNPISAPGLTCGAFFFFRLSRKTWRDVRS